MGNPRKPDIWEEKMDYTSEMDLYTDVLKDIEHGKLLKDIKAGIIKDKYYPYESYEGGTKTIGFGHKIGKDPEIDKLYDFEGGLSEPQIQELFLRDLDSAYKRTWQHFFNQHGQKAWDRLSDKSKVALTELSYNIGNTKAYEKAFHDKDKKEVVRLIRKRGYTGTEGEVNTLGPRNEQIIRDYITPDDWSEETSYMNQWNKEDNIFA